MPLNNFPQNEGPESYQDGVAQLPSPTTYEEAKSALQDNTWLDTAVGYIARNRALSELNSAGGRKLTPEEANSKYPNLPNPFREDTNENVAQFLYDQYVEKQKREQIIASGPKDSWSRTKLAGVGILSHLEDPIETGSMLIGGAALGGAARAGTFGTTAAGLARSAAWGGRFAVGLGENAVLGTAQVAGLEAWKAQTMGREGVENYDPHEGFQNVVSNLVAAPIFAAFGATLGGLRTRLPEGVEAPHVQTAGDIAGNALSRRLDEMSPEAKTAVIRSAIADVSEGRLPDASRIMEALSKETSVSSFDFPEKFNYQYTPLGDTVPAGKKFYIAAEGGEFNSSKRFFTSDPLGDGTHMTDNPGVANAAAARSMENGHGVVWEVTPKRDLNIMKLDQPIPEQAQAAFQKALGEIGYEDPKLTASEMTGKEAIDEIYSSVKDAGTDGKVLTDLQQALKDAGYDALHEDGSLRNGAEHEPHNATMLLDDEAVTANKFYEPDASVRNPPSQELIDQAISSREGLQSRVDLDPRAPDIMVEKAKTVEFDSQKWVKDISDNVDTMLEDYKLLEEQGHLSPEEVRGLEVLREQDARNELESRALKAAIVCVGA